MRKPKNIGMPRWGIWANMCPRFTVGEPPKGAVLVLPVR